MSNILIAAMFMEHWKRRQMRLNYEWDLTGFEDEEVSPSVCLSLSALKRLYVPFQQIIV